MRFYPTKTSIALLCFIVCSISLNLGCSKDSDLLIDSVLEDTSTAIEERTLDNGEVETSNEQENVATVEENTTVSYETRTTSFSPSNDAHIQSGKGYNQKIIRLEEGQRPGFLMFDLSPINTVNGTIAAATLQFTINSDNGSGKIAAFKGSSNEWTENNLSESIAPEIEVELGSLIKEYEIGATESIVLTPELILSEVYTLILHHSGGNDLAFASKEHALGIGPKLVVTYEVPEGSNAIVIVEETNEEVTTAEETSEEETTPAETTPEETTPEETTPEVPSSTNEEPIAVADATPSSGGVPLVVAFKGSNSSDDIGITGYIWDFKDGATDTSANPSHTYTKAGSYEATLTVVDAEGLSTTDTVTITVTEVQNEAPKAMVSATPVSGEAPLEVSFKGSDSTDDHSIASYAWDFKDGSKTNVADFKYTYTAPGTYAADLTVTDENGLSNKKSITITVTAPQNAGPVAVVSANPTSGQAPLNVQFTGANSTDDKTITSYFWDFKDGSTSSSSNPSHSFEQAGSYSVDLTVKDVEGASSTKSVTINVASTNTGGGNVPPGYYVATNGNSLNNGQSPSSPWSLEYAFSIARAGNIFYVKAGDYGNKNLVQYNSGNASSPIKFIGYTNTPGDITSNQGSTFSYGESLNKNKMPLLKGNSPLTGLALDLNGNNVEIHNFQVTNYQTGILTKGRNVLLKNLIITNNGEQNNNNSQTGNGFQILGDYTVLENCFNLNSNAQGVNLKGASNCIIKKTHVYSDNIANPGGYYIAITNGGSNNVIEDCLIYRHKNADKHQGHGFVMKDQATNNIVRRSTAYNTGIEVNFSGVSNNTFDDVKIYGSYSEDSKEFSSGIRILNGAHHNTFQNIYIEDSRYPFNFHDFNDGYTGPGGDRDLAQGGNNNNFINVVTEKSNSLVLCNTLDTPVGQSTSSGNTWTNCSFSNVSSIPFFSSHITSNFKFNNCTFKNMSGEKLFATENGKGSWNATYQNSTISNVNFYIPSN